MKKLERKRISRDGMFSRITQVVAMRSTCHRAQVGALIVKDGRIISMGYNGPASGMPACVVEPEKGEVITMKQKEELYMAYHGDYICKGAGCDRSIHAEVNAIAFAARAGVSVEGCTMYCSLSPCINCAKVIVNSGIKKLVYLKEYRDKSGIEFLRRMGIETKFLGEEEPLHWVDNADSYLCPKCGFEVNNPNDLDNPHKCPQCGLENIQ